MTSKTVFLALSFTAFAIVPLTAAATEDEPSWTLSGSAAFKSDYVFRGFSQTDERPTVQAQIAATHKSGLSASLWGANVDFNDGDEAGSELDATLSYAMPAGPGQLTIGGVYYAYPGADDDLDYDYYEGFATYGLTVLDQADITVGVYYSPDFFAGSGDAVYTNIGVSVPLSVPGLDGLSVNGGAGYQWIDDEDAFGAPDYAEWTLGAAYDYKNLTFGVNYYDTDLPESDCGGLCSDRVVIGVSASF